MKNLLAKPGFERSSRRRLQSPQNYLKDKQGHLVPYPRIFRERERTPFFQQQNIPSWMKNHVR